MFTPLNKETSKKRLRSIVKERRLIKYTYYRFLTNFEDLDKIFSIKVEFDENSEVLSQVREYSLYNLLLKNEEAFQNKDLLKYDVFNYKKVLFLYIRIILKKKEFLVAKKLLNICKERGYMSNEYYEILEKIKKRITQ